MARCEKKIRTLSDDLKAASERMMSMEKMRSTLVDQINTLTRSLEERESALRVAEQKAEQLSTRHDELTHNATRDRDAWERSTADLREKFEREHAERVLVEGALRAAREERHLPHGDDDLEEEEEKASPAKPVMSQSENVGAAEEKEGDSETDEFVENIQPLQKSA
jgi:chromosome segregation ATPase